MTDVMIMHVCKGDLSTKEFTVGYVDGGSRYHVSVLCSEIKKYMDRLKMQEADLVLHEFPDECRAICLKQAVDNYVELDKIPYVNANANANAKLMNQPKMMQI